ncbi:hypothetical protein SFUMM280S_07195 [Streptomyces fumanus]
MSGPRGGARTAPLPLLLPAVAGLAFLLLPLIALLVRTPWSTLPDQLTSTEVWQALRLSLLCATSATVLSLVVGVPLAWLLARTDFPGRALVRALVTLPLVLPPVVGGVALLLAFGRNGVVGQWLERPVRDHHPVHHHGRRPRRDLRGHAVPGHQRGGHRALLTPATRRRPPPWAPPASPPSAASPCR